MVQKGQNGKWLRKGVSALLFTEGEKVRDLVYTAYAEVGGATFSNFQLWVPEAQGSELDVRSHRNEPVMPGVSFVQWKLT